MPFALRESQTARELATPQVCRMCRVFGCSHFAIAHHSRHSHRNNITFIIISVVNINKCFVLFARNVFTYTLAPALVTAESILASSLFFILRASANDSVVSFVIQTKIKSPPSIVAKCEQSNEREKKQAKNAKRKTKIIRKKKQKVKSRCNINVHCATHAMRYNNRAIIAVAMTLANVHCYWHICMHSVDGSVSDAGASKQASARARTLVAPVQTMRENYAIKCSCACA